MKPNDLDIAGLRELEKKATKDKWWVERCQEHGVPLLKYKWDDVPTWIAEGSVRENAFNDFRFISALRNAASDLLALAEIGKAVQKIRPDEWEYIIKTLEHGSDRQWAIASELRAALKASGVIQ